MGQEKSEWRFALKSLIIAALFISLGQIKTSKGTLEARAQTFLVGSGVSGFLNEVAHGGAQMLKDVTDYGAFKAKQWYHLAVNKSADVVSDKLKSTQAEREQGDEWRKKK